MAYEEIKEQICDICHKMWQLGWVAANDGNITVKLDDGTFLATPTGISKSLDRYDMIETVVALGSIPITPYGTPSTYEVPEAIAPYIQEHDAVLLENHGALTVGSNLVEAYYKMETLELFAKINLNAYLLGGPKEISRENIDKLINLRSYYGVKGRHPGYKHYKED